VSVTASKWSNNKCYDYFHCHEGKIQNKDRKQEKPVNAAIL
jgi:hypothetical protein